MVTYCLFIEINVSSGYLFLISWLLGILFLILICAAFAEPQKWEDMFSWNALLLKRFGWCLVFLSLLLSIFLKLFLDLFLMLKKMLTCFGIFSQLKFCGKFGSAEIKKNFRMSLHCLLSLFEVSLISIFFADSNNYEGQQG